MIPSIAVQDRRLDIIPPNEVGVRVSAGAAQVQVVAVNNQGSFQAQTYTVNPPNLVIVDRQVMIEMKFDLDFKAAFDSLTSSTPGPFPWPVHNGPSNAITAVPDMLACWNAPPYFYAGDQTKAITDAKIGAFDAQGELKAELGLVLYTGDKLTQIIPNIVCKQFWTLRQAPLNRLIQQSSVTINGETISDNHANRLDAMLEFGRKFSDLADWRASAFKPSKTVSLSSYYSTDTSATHVEDTQVPSNIPSIVENNPSNPFGLTITLREPLLMEPFFHGFGPREEGLVLLNTMLLNFNLYLDYVKERLFDFHAFLPAAKTAYYYNRSAPPVIKSGKALNGFDVQTDYEIRFKADEKQMAVDFIKFQMVTVTAKTSPTPKVILKYFSPDPTYDYPMEQLLTMGKYLDYKKLIPNENTYNDTKISTAVSVADADHPFAYHPGYGYTTTLATLTRKPEPIVVQCDTVRLAFIPHHLLLFSQRDTQEVGEMGFLPISKVSITFENYTNILAQYSQDDLYEIARENGATCSYSQWCFTRGGVLKLLFGKDIPLPEGYSVGMPGSFTIQITVTYLLPVQMSLSSSAYSSSAMPYYDTPISVVDNILVSHPLNTKYPYQNYNSFSIPSGFRILPGTAQSFQGLAPAGVTTNGTAAILNEEKDSKMVGGGIFTQRLSHITPFLHSVGGEIKDIVGKFKNPGVKKRGGSAYGGYGGGLDEDGAEGMPKGGFSVMPMMKKRRVK